MSRRPVLGASGVAATVLGATTVKAVKHRRQAAQGYSLPSVPAVTEAEFERLLEALTGACVTGGTSVTVLRNGWRTGSTGGVGIAEEWTGDCEDEDHWRDTHLRVEGPAVRGLYGGFLEDWVEASRPRHRHALLRGR